MPTYRNEDTLRLPLNEILIQRGYQIKKEKSSKNFITLSHENGDNLVVSRQSNGHYLYFNTNDDRDRGNIYSFCKNRGLSLEELTKQVHEPLKHTLANTNTQEEIKNQELIKNYNEMKDLSKENHFEKRMLDYELLEKFQGLKQDKYKNICVPSFSLKEVQEKPIIKQCGYIAYLKNPLKKDKKGNEYKRPIKSICYGNKGLEILKQKDEKIKLKDYKQILITESSIDSLSLFEILTKQGKSTKEENTLICATNGTVTKNQEELIKYLDENLSKAKFVLGFDKDEKGFKFQEQVKELIKHNKIEIKEPVLKDFNDDLFMMKTFNLKQDFKIKELEEIVKEINKPIKEYLNKEYNQSAQGKARLKQNAIYANNALVVLKPKLENYVDFSQSQALLSNLQKRFKNTNEKSLNHQR